MKNKICRWLFFVAVGIVLFGVVKTASTEKDIESGTLAPVEDKQAIGAILERLIGCESGGNPDAVAVNDGNTGLDSKGVLQFQLPTFQRFALKYQLFPEAEAKELENLWTDPDAQIKVATKMLEDDMKNLNHWYNCRIKIGVVL